MPTPWILLAEDNDDDLALAQRAIRKAQVDCRVEVARNGQEAIAKLGLAEGCVAPPKPPDLVLLDIKMPMLGGIDALARIRACDPYKLVPVVMLSSSDEPSDLRACYELGANSYTVKPVVYEDFIEQLASTIRYWITINRMPSAKGSEAGIISTSSRS